MNAGEKQKHAGEEEPKAETDKRENSMNSVSKWWHDPAHVIQSIGIFIGSCVAIIYGLQLNQMIESNRINREALESVQRAFVTYQGIKQQRFQDVIKKIHYWAFDPTFENSGVTPAVNAINYVNADALPTEPNEEQFRGEPKQWIVETIGPKAVQHAGALNVPESLVMGNDYPETSVPPDVSARTRRDGKGFFVWGWVVYGDVIPNTKLHLTEFCRQIEVLGAMPVENRVGFVAHNCKQHNCTDEYCEDYKEIIKFSTRK